MTKYPFSKDELRDIGVRPALPIPGLPGGPTRKFDTPITPKENFLRVCRKEKPVWMPIVSTDFNFLWPIIMPDVRARIEGGFDWFGIEWEYEPLSNAGMVKPGTRRLSDIVNWEEELVFPDLSEIDWQKDYEENYKDLIDPDRPTTFMIVNGLFERTADLTSFEDTFCYLLEEPEALHAFYSKLADWHIELIKIAKDVYGADLITFHDDMGTQRSSFFSPKTYREILLPHYQKITKAAHDMGLYINLHSCGVVENQIENFCDAGFDFWEGQDACNDKVAIINEYGDRLGQLGMCFLPENASDEEFENFIEERVHVWGETGRYMIWPIDTNFERGDKGIELIYQLSRELYSK